MAASLGVAVAIVALVVAVRHDAYCLAVVWSALMLASFAGWGSVVNVWLSRGRWVDWGLRAGWGMAFSILTGGVLCLARLAVRPVLVAQVALGVAALLGTSAMRRSTAMSFGSLRRRLVVMFGRAGVLALVAGAYAIALFIASAYLGDHRFNPSDDPPLYFTFAQKLVQTSSILEPFASRRISTLGGQAYLHASFISTASIYYLHFVDDGLALVLVVALVVGHVRGSGFKPWRAVPLVFALALLLSVRAVRVNTASLMSGVAAILTLYRTVRAPPESDSDRPRWPMETRRVIALAALTVVPIVLRTSNTAAVLPFMILVLASDFALGERRPWARESLTSLVRVGSLFAVVFVLALLPWSVMLKQSCGTFFYPLGHDNLTQGAFLKAANTRVEVATSLVTHLFHEAPVGGLLPFMAAGLLPLAGRARNDLVALTLASFIGIVALAREVTGIEPYETCRYYYAYVVAMSLLAAASVERIGGRAALVSVALAMHLTIGRDERKYFTDYVAMASQAYLETNGVRDTFDAPTGDYRDVQSYVPVGATMATAVLENYRFDFTRNRIFALDVLGGMGPKPGWPTHQGAKALADYLRSSGVQYLLWVDFNLPSEFYNRAHWQSLLTQTGSYLSAEAALQLDAEDAIDGIAKICHVAYRAHGMTVVDLASAP
jgi:hypothetical protein